MTDNTPYKEPSACQAEKRIHDLCFFNWYQEEFLTGRETRLDAACQDQWDTYKTCLEKKLDAMNLQTKIKAANENKQ